MKKKSLFSWVTLFLLLLFIPFISRAQQWVVIANEQQIASEISSFTHIVTAIDGAITIPYVVYTESGVAKVKNLMAIAG